MRNDDRADAILAVDEARARLSVALDEFERELPDAAGPNDWPAMTPALAQRFQDVRALARAATIGASDTFDVRGSNPGWAHWPRPVGLRCGGHGWHWLDPDLSAEGWEPCRRCMTTGLSLTTADHHRTTASGPDAVRASGTE